MRSDGAITETLPCKSNNNSIVAQRALQFFSIKGRGKTTEKMCDLDLYLKELKGGGLQPT